MMVYLYNRISYGANNEEITAILNKRRTLSNPILNERSQTQKNQTR